MDAILYQSLDEEGKARYNAQKARTPKFITWIKTTYKKLLGSKPMEVEHEIILDHNYDGIKELDNNLPPWWLYGFYASIVFAAIYLIRYHIFNGDNQYKELEIEYAEAKIAIEAYKKTAKDLVDFNTVELLTDASDLGSGKKIFETNCVACHMSDGGGGIGPNLTDKYWILGGGIKNVFKTISEGGRGGKGMIAWKQQLKPSEMAQVARYVLQFQGTTFNMYIYVPSIYAHVRIAGVSITYEHEIYTHTLTYMTRIVNVDDACRVYIDSCICFMVHAVNISAMQLSLRAE